VKHITDMGGPVYGTSTVDGETSPLQLLFERYGVWERGEVIDTGADLDELQRKHGPGLPLHTITDLTVVGE